MNINNTSMPTRSERLSESEIITFLNDRGFSIRYRPMVEIPDRDGFTSEMNIFDAYNKIQMYNFTNTILSREK